MKVWKSPVPKAAVEEAIRSFFARLCGGDLEGARGAVEHRWDDWDHQVWSLWQDTWLIVLEERDEEVEDESFEGGLWRSDLHWLSQLGLEGRFHWSVSGESATEGDSVWVNLTVEGEVTDVSAEFTVVQSAGGLVLRRDALRMA